MFIFLADKIISIIALLILSPLLFVIAVCVYFDLGNPIIFKQKRVGLHGKVFEIYKFRSMKNSNSSEVLQAHEETDRISKFGNFLRNSNFDELPQLINILKGDISVVGPRPHEVSQDRLFSRTLENYTLRHEVLPGLTGLAQVSGLSGPIKSQDQLIQRTEYDISWVNNKSIFLYFKIILSTFLIFVRAVLGLK